MLNPKFFFSAFLCKVLIRAKASLHFFFFEQLWQAAVMDGKPKILSVIAIDTNSNQEYTYFAGLNTSLGYSNSLDKNDNN